MWGGYYIGANSSDFRRDVFDTDEFRFADFELPPGQKLPDPEPKTVAELMEIGEQRYKTICIACHKPKGEGDPTQQYPPLDGSEWVAGDQASAARLARIVLYGLNQPITVKGQQFNGQMPPQGPVLRDYEIASVLTYIRNSWSNKGDPDDAKPAVTIDVVKAARAKVGKRGPMTAEELLKIPLTYSDVEPEVKK
jgi:mono/diheme cytochrome c family protein